MVPYPKFLFLFLLLLHQIEVKAQTFEKDIDSNFKGDIAFCTEMQNSYYFIGSWKQNDQIKLHCFKTNKSGNVLIENSKHILTNKQIKFVKDSFNHILVADSNKLIKFNADLNILWTKTITGLGAIQSIKANSSGKCIISTSNNVIFYTDSSGGVLPISYSYNLNYDLVDFDLLKDTLYALFYQRPTSNSNSRIILQKMDAFSNKIADRIFGEFGGYVPHLLVVDKKQNKCLVLTDLADYKRATISMLSFDDNFNYLSKVNQSFPNLWITSYHYNNNSFLIGGDYDGKSSSDVLLVQLDKELQIKFRYDKNHGYYFDNYLTDDGYILSAFYSNFIRKINTNNSTFTESRLKSGSLNFYPNPFNNITTASITFAKNLQIELYDSKGKILLHKEFENSDEIMLSELDMKHSGIYFYQILADDVLYSGKLIKE